LAIPRVKREVQQFKPDLVHAHYAAGNGLLGLCAGARPLVTSVWGSDIAYESNSYVVNRIVDKVLLSSDHLTATSEYLKSRVIHRVKANSEQVSVIPFGVQILSQIAPFPPSVPFKICCLKAQKPVYGAEILIKSISEIIKLGREVLLTIAGERNEYTLRLEKVAGELGLNKKIKFTGLIDHDRIYSLIEKHHVLVMQSRMEGFGVAAAEGSACGRPVIATNVGGIPEIVHDGKTGLLVEVNNPAQLADAILKLANDNELCHKMGQAGYEFVKENYDWEKSLDKMSQLYERLINDFRKS
jgi:glycosyltransferase involved in cell wall biosynthesis